MSNGDFVECPVCGYKVLKRGLGGHKGSKRCASRVEKQELEEDGYIPISKKLKNYLDNKGYETVRGAVGYTPGSWTYPSRITYSYWTKEEIAEKYKDDVLSGSEYPQWDKIGETDKYLLLKIDRYNKNEMDVFKKDEPGKTRKYRFKVKDNLLYTSDQFKFGRRIEGASEIPEKFISDLVKFELDK